MTREYRVLTTAGANAPDEGWFSDLPAAVDAVAARLGTGTADAEALRKAVNLDPVVVWRDGVRWRSRGIWNIRRGDAAVRIYEMLRIDEAQYDH